MKSQFKARLVFISVLLSLGGLIVITRLFSIQIINGAKYAERSRDQTQQRRILTAKRGMILDCKGRVMASSIESHLTIESHDLGSVPKENYKAEIKRMYPHGEIAGAVLGYVGKEGYGLGGIEFTYDNYLRGEDGWIILQKDGKNHRYSKIGLPSKQPHDGNNVYLTIDLDIQKIAHTVLKQTVTQLGAKDGMCMVMDPHSGKILAMANEPAFNPNIPFCYTLTQRQNRCINTVYEPGSTFKIVTASAVIQENIKKESDIIDGNKGVFKICNGEITDHEQFGLLTFAKALAFSSNVCFAKLANEVGNERLYKYTRDFGFGSKSGIELPGEECGIVHPIMDWSGRTRVTMAIGQEISVTLLQMMLPYAAVANGGILVTPVICEKVEENAGKIIEQTEYKPVRRVLSEKSALRLRKMLKGVVDEGTGKNAKIDGITVAGKTGTSQKPDSGTYSKYRYWSSFIGFVPAEDPVLLCGVVIDEPASSEMGGVAAAPAFRKIMNQIISDPELEYAERILHGTAKDSIHTCDDKVSFPSVCGISKDSVAHVLDSLKIRYQLVGNGPTVTYQSPAAGVFVDKNEELVVYALEKHSERSQTMLPDCIGKDLRDAVNVINIKGLKTFAVGSGIVVRQTPPGGVSVKPAEVCTLYCAFRG